MYAVLYSLTPWAEKQLTIANKVNSKSWKLVFRGFPYMGMFD